MRINEIASAEDQMALWRLVSDSVWQAIETQRQQQAQAEQTKAAKAKLKPRGSRKGKSRSAAPMPTRKLTQMVNKLKIETSISLRMRDEEVEIHGKSNCWDIGRR